MSFAHLQVPYTELPAPVGAGSLVRVDLELYAVIYTNLPDHKWTYLEIRADSLVEIVRVVGHIFPDQLILQRGRDGTKPLAFPAGAIVKYVPTAEAIRDTVIPNLSVAASGIISYHDGVFDVPPLSIVGLGGALSGGIFTQHGQGCGRCEDTPAIPDSLRAYRIVADGNFRITDDGSYRAYA